MFPGSRLDRRLPPARLPQPLAALTSIFRATAPTAAGATYRRGCKPACWRALEPRCPPTSWTRSRKEAI